MARSKRKVKSSGTTSPSKKPSPFRLLDLPLETRLRIYRACFEPPYPDPASDPIDVEFGCDHKLTHQSLLLICRQIHAEVWPIYAENHVFVFSNPLDFGNHFLSLLPPQRLSAIKHVTWLQSNDPLGRETQNFERLWWHYLDIFAGLDTFSIEHRSDMDRTHHPGMNQMWSVTESARAFDRCIPLLVGLLQQGGTKKPTKVTKEGRFKYRNYRKLRTTDAALPNTRKWLLQAAFMQRSPSASFHYSYQNTHRLKVVVRYLPTYIGDNLIGRDGHADMFADWKNMRMLLTDPRLGTPAPPSSFFPCRLWISSTSDAASGLTDCVVRATDSFDMRGRLPIAARFQMGPFTRVVESSDKARDGSVEVASIVGEWIKQD